MKTINSYIFHADFGKVQELLGRGTDVNGKYGIGIRPIIAAINSDSPKMVSLVLKHGADVNIDDGAPLRTIIDLSIDGMIQDELEAPFPAHLEILRILLENGADLEMKDENGSRPIDVIPAYGTNRKSLDRLKNYFRPIIPELDSLLEQTK